ncbi:hypothetical protein F5I97DRAFT_1927581 [Phlebopus sp. FC_14]|nr:hypothetical protein F5I97DRAFT_1927581 [Phlebopus sp. FC_14]
MTTSLINAHAEAGSWEGVVRIFDYLLQSSYSRLDLSIEVYNTLVGMRPDGYTYILVIPSACDAAKMDVAEGVICGD